MKKLISSIVILGLLSLLFLATAMVEEGDAIPAFARKYRMSCTTCHAPLPRLKEYGDEFAGNGFVLKDKDAPGYFVDTGDRNLSLIRDWPIAARLEGWIRHESSTGNETDLSVPMNLKLLSGGSLGKNIAYYFYFYLSERGEVAGVEDAYIMFNDLLGQDLDVYVGQFQVSDPLFKRELRLTYEDYFVYTMEPGLSNMNLKYDRGIMITYGAPTGTDVIFEIFNGNGLAEAEGPEHIYDDDKYKNVFGRVSQGIGEYLRIGAFGYYGKEADIAEDTAVGAFVNEAWMIGGDATLGYGPVELNLQYIERRDDNPGVYAADAVGDEIESRGGLAELIVWPDGDQSKWYGAALFNYAESDIETTYNRLTGHLGYMVFTNLRLTAENTYDIENEENRFMLGFVAAF